MGPAHAATLVSSLFAAIVPASPLLNSLPPRSTTAAVAATGHSSTPVLDATHASSSAAVASTSSREGWLGWVLHGECYDGNSQPSMGVSRGYYTSTELYSGRQEFEEQVAGKVSTGSGGDCPTTTDAVVGVDPSMKTERQRTHHEDGCQLGREGGEKRDGPEEWKEEEQEEELSTVSSRLQDVIDQLQGDIQNGATPQVRSNIQLDGLFSELRTDQEGGDHHIGTNSKTPATVKTAVAAPSPTEPKAFITPDKPKQKQQRSSGALTASAVPSDTLDGSQDLESLSDMLDRVKAVTEARDLAQAQARSLAIRSGGPIGDDPNHSWVTIGNQRDMKTRFKRIREGRVGWAVLPLVMKAKNAGIPLTTGVYNAAIAAYSGTPRKHEDALRVLNMLRREDEPGVRPDLGSYNAAMWVCSEAGEWRLVMELMDQARQDGIEPDTTSYNHAMKGMAIKKQWGRARKLLKRMVSVGLSPDVKTYNALAEAAGMGSAHPRETMIAVVREMEQAGVEPNSYTFTVLLNCLERRRKAFDGFQVMARLVDARAPLQPLGHRAGLSFCNVYGDWRRAMVLMEDMRVAKRRPSGQLYLLAVKACAKGGQWERALSLMVERRTLDAREEKEANDKNGGRPLWPKKAQALAKSRKQMAKIHMETLEAVMSAVSEAGQYEVASRLVQQMRAAGDTPSKKCYLYALRAASKWGRWDVIESLMKDMRTLGVGVVGVNDDNTDRDATKSAADSRGAGDAGRGRGAGLGGGGGGRGGENRSRALSQDCYAPLVEAYAQASMWERAIEAFQEGYPLGEAEEVEPVNYRVYECVLKACVGANDGQTALEVLHRQAAEPKRLELQQQQVSSALTNGMRTNGIRAARKEETERQVSGGPPDRRCWCLAAEALGRAGMIEEGHRVLMAMVNSGIPLRESTKADVPSLMPLPTAEDVDDFEWNQRKRVRSPRQGQQGTPRSPSSAAVTLGIREAAIRERLGTSPSFSVASASSGFPSENDDVDGDAPASTALRDARDDDAEAPKQYLNGLDLPKGVVNGEGCTAAAVAAAAAATSGGRKTSGMGWLLAKDLSLEAAEVDAGGEGRALMALDRKRRRMREYSRRKKKQQEKLERLLRKGEGGEIDESGDSSSSNGGGVNGQVTVDNTAPPPAAATAAAAATVNTGAPQIHLRPGGKRGRNEALTLRMRVGTPRILGKFGAGSGIRGRAFDRTRRKGIIRRGVAGGKDRRRRPEDYRSSSNVRGRNGDVGGSCGDDLDEPREALLPKKRMTTF